MSVSAHWQAMAHRWAQLGSPLRPLPEDLGYVREAAHAWASRQGRPPRVQVLGVTPELCRLDWPEGSVVHGADRNPDMIAAVWPGDPARVRRVDWLSLGELVPAGSVDIAVCDGGLHLLGYPEGQAAFLTSMADLLAPGGLLILRLFTPPVRRETPEQVLAALRAGAIADMNRLKLRLAAALQPSAAQGVRLGDVWARLALDHPDLDALARERGWSRAHVDTIASYRESGDRYHFTDESEVRELVAASGAFRVEARHQPGYPDGERFPTIVLSRL